MRIGITGITGFIGSRIAALAHQHKHEVIGFSRRPGKRPSLKRFDPPELPDVKGLDAVIHLAGESVLGLWTPLKKRRILRSRVEGTRLIVQALREQAPGAVLISASAVGYYGGTGDTAVKEMDRQGHGFLADVCVAWEEEAMKAREHGARVAVVRTGLVLGKQGGAYPLLRRVFGAGAGGNLGSGEQWMAPIHIDDLAALYLHLAENAAAKGPFNGTAPEPIRNAEFTQLLAGMLNRKAFLHVPTLLLRMIPGGAGSMFLDSQRVMPVRTVESGFSFQFRDTEAILKGCL